MRGISSLRRLTFVFGVLVATAFPLHADDWPQWLGPQRDGVWRETGIVEALPTNGFTYRWRTPIGGGYSGPAVLPVTKPAAGSCAEWLSLSI
jgi:hypothetical protein